MKQGKSSIMRNPCTWILITCHTLLQSIPVCSSYRKALSPLSLGAAQILQLTCPFTRTGKQSLKQFSQECRVMKSLSIRSSELSVKLQASSFMIWFKCQILLWSHLTSQIFKFCLLHSFLRLLFTKQSHWWQKMILVASRLHKTICKS